MLVNEDVSPFVLDATCMRNRDFQGALCLQIKVSLREHVGIQGDITHVDPFASDLSKLLENGIVSLFLFVLLLNCHDCLKLD